MIDSLNPYHSPKGFTNKETEKQEIYKRIAREAVMWSSYYEKFYIVVRGNGCNR